MFESCRHIYTHTHSPGPKNIRKGRERERDLWRIPPEREKHRPPPPCFSVPFAQQSSSVACLAADQYGRVCPRFSCFKFFCVLFWGREQYQRIFLSTSFLFYSVRACSNDNCKFAILSAAGVCVVVPNDKQTRLLCTHTLFSHGIHLKNQIAANANTFCKESKRTALDHMDDKMGNVDAGRRLQESTVNDVASRMMRTGNATRCLMAFLFLSVCHNFFCLTLELFTSQTKLRNAMIPLLNVSRIPERA